MVEMMGIEMDYENLHPKRSNSLKSLALNQQSRFDLYHEFGL